MFNGNIFSENEEINFSYCFNSSNNIIDEWISNNNNSKQKKKIFEVFHKKETIYSNPEPISNNIGKSHQIFQYKCIYCGNKYNNMNRFEAHMRIHVSK